MKSFKLATLAAVLAAGSHFSAQAANCSTTDVIAETGLTVLGCLGYYDGNVNNNAPATAFVEAAAETAWGIDLPSNILAQNSFSGVSSSSFSGVVEGGVTVIGIHWGGAGGGVTGLYGVMIGSGWDGTYNFASTNPATGTGGSSNLALYGTGLVAAVPEPETYALMVAGLAALGFMVRRRRQD